MHFPIVIVRFSEIGLKSKRTRKGLRRLLRQNILARLKADGVQFSGIEDTWERLFVRTHESEKAANAIARVFGVATTSPAIECVVRTEAVAAIVTDMAREKLKAGESFAIRVRRTGNHAFTSIEVARSLGSSVIKAMKDQGTRVGVDLDSPDHEFYVEVRQDRCFIYDSINRGVGGLPLGSQGKVVSYLTDYESILATWLIMKRGATPTMVTFVPQQETQDLILLCRSSLLPYSSGSLSLIEVSLSEVDMNIESPQLRSLLQYMVINELALSENAEAIVVSERFGPTETLKIRMLSKYSGLVAIPVHYPLAGFDDEFVKHLAKRIAGEQLVHRIEEKRPAVTGTSEDNLIYQALDVDKLVSDYQFEVKKTIATAHKTQL